MKKKWIKCLAGAGIAVGILAAIAPAAGAAGLPDASCTVNPGVLLSQADGNRKTAQTFPAIHTGGLDTAQTTVENDVGTSGDWSLEIAATSGGVPAGILASTTVPNTIPSGTVDVITGTFASPAQVTAGTLYALLISRPGSGPNGYDVAEQGGDPCPGQQAYFQNAVSGPFLEFPFVDLGFATTVQPPTSAGTTPGKKCKKKHKKRAALAKKHKKCKKKKRK
jgi:hypothetical protein